MLSGVHSHFDKPNSQHGTIELCHCMVVFPVRDIYHAADIYHGCWCPGSWRRQDISSHDIDHVEEVGSCLIWGRISTTCVVSMWRNDTKCEYMFMFPLKNFGRKGLIKNISGQLKLYYRAVGWPHTISVKLFCRLQGTQIGLNVNMIDVWYNEEKENTIFIVLNHMKLNLLSPVYITIYIYKVGIL